MEGGSGAGSAAQPADLDWEASEVTAPRRGCARPAGVGAALPPRTAPRPPARSGVCAGSAGSESGKTWPFPTV